eukprot:TRINITY_DN144_c6_g1_i1.p1 TRINITY_DN144_c6_g1~~TRINITY_DN144_c6_g1_i1.p1  ORF type:complete len:1864 (+),score=450.68 TRINITY_DN144_c6_g1_i1:65-5593(+)
MLRSTRLLLAVISVLVQRSVSQCTTLTLPTGAELLGTPPLPSVINNGEDVGTYIKATTGYECTGSTVADCVSGAATLPMYTCAESCTSLNPPLGSIRTTVPIPGSIKTGDDITSLLQSAALYTCTGSAIATCTTPGGTATANMNCVATGHANDTCKAINNTLTNACKSVVADSWMDMSSWLQAGLVPRWKISNSGRTIEQFVNTPDPGFYISDDDTIIDVVIKGTIAVHEQFQDDGTKIGNDDDFIGIGLGMHGPLPSDLNLYDGMLFSWGGFPTSGFQPHKGDWMLQLLNGRIPYTGGHCSGAQGACFWYRTDSHPVNCSLYPNGGGCPDRYVCDDGAREKVGCFEIQSTPSASNGWRLGETYTFSVLFTEEVLRISINGQVRIDVTQSQAIQFCKNLQSTSFTNHSACEREAGKAWRKGRLAWYNLSQHGVQYGNIRKFDVTKGMPSTPVTSEDVFGVRRGGPSRDLQELKYEFYDGVIANDFSPELRSLTAVIAPTWAEDPQTSTPTGVGICEKGSTLTLEANGAFTFTPNPALNSGTDVSEMCRYKVRDSTNVWSEMTDITFALEPMNFTCLDNCFDLNWLPCDHDHDWYNSIVQDSVFGEVIANGSCLRITEYSLPDGGAGQRFTFKGNKIVAREPSQISQEFLSRTIYRMAVRATDIFGQSVQQDIDVTIPAECETLNLCVCSANGFSCECLPGMGGARCDQCADNRLPSSQNNQNCTLCATCPVSSPPAGLTATGPCLYPTGQCTVFCTPEHNCSSHGRCSNDSLTPGKCVCDENWTGDKCDVCADDYYTPATNCSKKCTPYICNNGTCDAEGNCVCPPDLGGPTCHFCAPPYFPPGVCNETCTGDKNCSSRGTCAFDDNGYPANCSCDDGWVGPYLSDGCDIPCSRAATCSGNGICNPLDIDGLGTNCICDTVDRGYSGNFMGDVCDECIPDWYPPNNCSVHCTVDTCNNHGNCSADGLSCECEDRWFGADCSIPCTRELNCSGAGDCDGNMNCVCDPHFTNSQCQDCVDGWFPAHECDTFCDPVLNCSGHGSCLWHGQGTCFCDVGYNGTDCSGIVQQPAPNQTDDSGCLFLEIGGSCFEWLLFLLLGLCLCLLCLAAYLLRKKPKKKKKKDEYVSDYVPLDGWEKADLDFNVLQPPTKEDDDHDFRNGGAPPGATAFGGANGFSGANLDFGNTNGGNKKNGGGHGFTGADLNGFDPVGASKNNNGFGAGSLGGMDAMKAAAAIAGLNAAAKTVASPQSDLSPLHKDQLNNDTNDIDKAIQNLRQAAEQASTDGTVPPETQQMLADALAGNWGAGDLGGMDPTAAQAAQVIGASETAVGKGDTPQDVKNKLNSALAAVKAANGELVTDAKQIAGHPKTSPEHKDILNKALGQTGGRGGGGGGGGFGGAGNFTGGDLTGFDPIGVAPPPAGGHGFGAGSLDGMSDLKTGAAVCALAAAAKTISSPSVPFTNATNDVDAAMKDLRNAVKKASKNSSVPPGMQKNLKDALNGEWGGGDLGGMDPTDAKNGQIVGATKQATSSPDIPPDVKQNLSTALAAVMAANGRAVETAKGLINSPNTPPNDKAVLSRAIPDFDGNVNMGGMNQMSGAGRFGATGPGNGFDGDVNLSGMDVLQTAPPPLMSSPSGNASGEQEAKSKGVLSAVVGNAINNGTVTNGNVRSAQEDYSSWYQNASKEVVQITDDPSLPEAARQQLLDGLNGKVSFLYGQADMSGMDPTKGSLEKAILSVLAAGGLSGSATSKLQELVREQGEKNEKLKTSVQEAIKDGSLSPTAKKELQEALAGRHSFGSADVDLNSSSFAPLSHAVHGGLPGLGAGFMQSSDHPVTYNTQNDDSLL